MTPKITFIVSAYDRPKFLACVLASLQVQSEEAIEVIVADNTKVGLTAHKQRLMVEGMFDDRFLYQNLGERTCYESSKALAEHAKGDWLCFPHDDGYYVPGFAERMLKCAADNPSAEFIYCDMLYDPRMSSGQGIWTVVTTSPRCGFIDKGGFLVKTALFRSMDWPPAPDDLGRDGLFVDALVSRGVVTAKAGGVMWVHN